MWVLKFYKFYSNHSFPGHWYVFIDEKYFHRWFIPVLQTLQHLLYRQYIPKVILTLSSILPVVCIYDTLDNNLRIKDVVDFLGQLALTLSNALPCVYKYNVLPLPSM